MTPQASTSVEFTCSSCASTLAVPDVEPGTTMEGTCPKCGTHQTFVAPAASPFAQAPAPEPVKPEESSVPETPVSTSIPKEVTPDPLPESDLSESVDSQAPEVPEQPPLVETPAPLVEDTPPVEKPEPASAMPVPVVTPEPVATPEPDPIPVSEETLPSETTQEISPPPQPSAPVASASVKSSREPASYLENLYGDKKKPAQKTSPGEPSANGDKKAPSKPLIRRVLDALAVCVVVAMAVGLILMAVSKVRGGSTESQSPRISAPSVETPIDPASQVAAQ